MKKYLLITLIINSKLNINKIIRKGLYIAENHVIIIK